LGHQSRCPLDVDQTGVLRPRGVLVQAPLDGNGRAYGLPGVPA